MVPFFLADCNANFIEKLLRPQSLNEIWKSIKKLINTCKSSVQINFSIQHTNPKFDRFF